MKINLHRKNPEVAIPAYQTPGAVAFDLTANDTVTIEPWAIALVPTGLVIATPPGHMLMLAARSSLPLKKGLMVANGVGIIDQDYCGPNDELKIQLLNITKAPVTVEKGERIAQGMFVKIERAEWEEGLTTKDSRGGFGSSGGYKQ
ncbi:MAG: dUTP diphosphatase [bacterium]|nr:dUTP diphosphatase [bacterium]